MPNCTVCGKKATAMRCICSDCLDPNTNLGAALNKGMDGLVELILNVHNTGDFCKEWNECVRKIEAGENIPDDLCNRCIEAWLRAPETRGGQAR